MGVPPPGSVLGMYTFVMMMQHISDRTFFEEKSAIEKKKWIPKKKNSFVAFLLIRLLIPYFRTDH